MINENHYFKRSNKLWKIYSFECCRLTSTPKRTLGDPKNNDFECIVTLKDQKQVAFYTMGDYLKHLLIAIDKYMYLDCEVLIIALNDKYENKPDELIKDCPYNIIDKSEPYQGNISKFKDCGNILSII
ncbi:hypothetical protein QF042_003679 [Pedobacter sp. W3I1]|uniref:hypothetical protein n=1 Tax=Pedobacter sp. W3I1 TaxID=3042291 RepID=UPI0027837850|nr:hypothetical protein [Pedobacter sp. W3I1]MDQ0640114.1 hypothetical protein [Pedobacter sp. W3I1]